LGPALVEAWKRGARFDSWKDRFDPSRWEESFSAGKIDRRAYLGTLERRAILPWDHIETGIKKEFLLSELAKAEKEERTPPCAETACADCRGCDLSFRSPKVRPPAIESQMRKPAAFGRRRDRDRPLLYEAFYEKSGLARFLSHRDLTGHLQRSLRRAGAEVAHSAGFHPKMLVSYAPALPLGMEAREECFDFKSFYQYDLRALLRRLQRASRSGIRFLRLRQVDDAEAPLNERIRAAVYSLDLKDEEVASALEARRRSLGIGTVDDVAFVQSEMARFAEKNPGSLASFRIDKEAMKLYLELPALSRRGLRPQDIVSAVAGLENASFRLTRERLVFRQEKEPPDRLSAD
jgi:radical SAM-linked protein